MTPAQHATLAATEAAFTSPDYVEAELAALRAQAHAILAGKTGSGGNYTTAEAALVNAAYALLAS